MRVASLISSLLVLSVSQLGCGTVISEQPDAEAPPDAAATTDATTDVVADAGLPDAAPGMLGVAVAGPVYLRTGGATSIPVEVVRGAGVDGAVEVTVASPLEGITFEPLTIAAGGSAGTLVANVGANARYRVGTLTVAAYSGGAGSSADVAIEVIGALGTVNRTFGNDGTVAFDTRVMRGTVIGVAAQGDASVVVATDGTRVRAIRVDVDGALDATFGEGGQLSVDLTTVGATSIGETRMSMDGLGRIAVAGNVARTSELSAPFVFRLTPEGAVDEALPPRILTPIGTEHSVTAVASLPDGGVRVLGGGKVNKEWVAWMARIRHDGRQLVWSDLADHYGLQVRRPAVQANGNLVLDRRDRVARLREDGQPDRSFGIEGETVLPTSRGDAQWASVQQLGSSFIVGGLSQMWRLHGDGRVDTTFGMLGYTTLPATGLEAIIHVVDLSEGRMLAIAAGIPLFGTAYYMKLLAVAADGSLMPETGDEGINDPLLWMGHHAATLTRRRVVVGGNLNEHSADVLLRQYWY